MFLGIDIEIPFLIREEFFQPPVTGPGMTFHAFHPGQPGGPGADFQTGLFFNFLKCADFQKFDGSLKMILSLTSQQVIDLKGVLEKSRTQGKIFFGLHESDRALMTCLIHSGSGNEVHFVDAADGGYALAAKQLKEQEKEKGQP